LKEVSCKVTGTLLREAQRRKIPSAALLEGLPYTLPHLKNKQERIHWTEFAQLLRNVAKSWSEDDFVRFGSSLVFSPLVRPLAIIAGLLFTPKDFYFWVNKPGKGGGNMLFSCVKPTCRAIGHNQVEIELTLDEGYEHCRPFFLISKGGFIVLPKLLNLSSAEVEMSETARSAIYHVTYPEGGGILGKVVRLLAAPFRAQAVARQLMENNEVLEARYQELETAKTILALQTTKLRTAHEIGELVHGELDLSRTVTTVTRTLIDVAGFAAAELLQAGDDLSQHREGVIPDRANPVEVQLVGRDKTIGTLRAWPAAGADTDERQDLLEFIAPSVAMALDNALAYRSLADYRENLEIKVEERTAELSQARDSLAQTVRSLGEAKASRDKIFANVNHEIRTPLTLVLLAAAELRTRLHGDASRGGATYIASIESNARRLLRLVDELLLLAAGQEHKLKVDPAPCDLSEVLRQIVAQWQPAASAHGLVLGSAIPERCSVVVDQIAIERVVFNLLSNALKFTPRGGSIQVELIAKAGDVSIEVRDTGIGIDEDLRKRLFGRFEQGAARAGGSGIGLSLVRDLVQAHGGQVDVESQRGGGSKFKVHLPLAIDTQPSGPRASALKLTSGAAPEDFGIKTHIATETVLDPKGSARATVLIAEDDPALATAVARLLLADDYKVVVAPDGISALRLAEQYHPDMLVSDVGMPGMDGYELTRRFRALPGNRLAPVLLLSAFANVAERLAGFDAGAVDYVIKPFEPGELRARVKSQLALRALALKLASSEKLAALGTLSAGLAHEMRNPANAIVNAVEPLRELLPAELLTAEQPVAQLMDVLRDGSSQIALLSRQLLGFRRSGELARSEIVFGDLFSRALALVKPVLRDVELRDKLGYRGPLHCAGPLLTQVLTNLLENAAQAAGPKGWIEVMSRAENERFVLEVGDSGPGVPVDLREKIFEPFFTTKPPGQGTGLGLTTARDIVQRHLGLLEVRSAHRGSVFHLELPLRPE
jgi:signal transduction histidine kinase